MFSEAVDLTIIAGGFGLAGVILNHEYPYLRTAITEYIEKNMCSKLHIVAL